MSAEVEAVYRGLLDAWNERDAAAYASLYTDDGSIVGFDGSTMAGRETIEAHLAGIFRDHTPATYVSVVDEVRSIAPNVTLLRAVAGMIPPNGDDIDPKLNATQALVAVRDGEQWRIAHFVNTPARFDGRPDDVETMTRRLRDSHA